MRMGLSSAVFGGRKLGGGDFGPAAVPSVRRLRRQRCQASSLYDYHEPWRALE